ncbi:MAG: HDOD domain-containing protein [Salinibacter sp.]
MSSTSEGMEEDAPTFLEDAPYSFVGAMSRELDSVLASILELAGQLPESSPGTTELATQIQEAGGRLRPVLRSLDHLRHLHVDQTERAPEAVDVINLADDLLEAHEQSAHEQGLALALETPDSPVDVTTDADTLRRALRHLLANAIACTREGEVTLHVAPTDAAVEFRVSDTGVGVPPDAVSSLFEAFAQRPPEEAPPAEDTPPKELRIGLWLARAFARHLGGGLQTESESETGSTLTLRVPCDRTDANGLGVGDRTAADASSPPADAEPPHLLVLEDNEVTQTLLERILQDDYRIDLAARADEAIQKARENEYDAFILDINLKGRRTGVEVLHSVQEMERYASAPVVACTAYSIDKHQKQFLQAGFDEVVTKPVTKRELVGTIEHELETQSSSEFQVSEESLAGIELPPLPTTLVEVSELGASDSSQDTEALTEVLEKDQVISQWLLQHINSAYYGIRASVETVERAVSYLGFQPVCNLVLTKVIGDTVSELHGPEAERVQRYIMKTSTLAAYIARELAKEFSVEAPETAYTGGMFAQIGRLALLSTEGEAYVDLWFEQHDRTASFQGPPPQGQEILKFKEDHVQKGRAMGKACNLSENLRAVLRGYRRPTKVDDQFQPLVSTIALALGVAHLAGDLDEDHPWGGEEALTEKLQDAGVTRNLAERESISSEELTSMIAGITGEAGEFVKDILDTVA